MSLFVRCLALTLILLLLAAWRQGGGEVILKQQKQASRPPKTSSVEAQLDKAQEMFNTRQPIPGLSSSFGLTGPSRSNAASSHSRGRIVGEGGNQEDRLGLQGMSQRVFIRRVEEQVSRRVAAALLRTMRPLKKVLREQQEKIRVLRRERNRMEEEQKNIAQKLSGKIKDGLLSHLKQDVDVELKRELKPRDILKYEKSKAALRKKMLAMKQETALQKPEEEEEERNSGDLRSAVKHSMSSALDGVLNEHKKPRESSPQVSRPLSCRR